jgi:hypothetical protein
MLCSVGGWPPGANVNGWFIGLVIGALSVNPVFTGGLVIGLAIGGFIVKGDGGVPGAGVAAGLDIGDVIGFGG